MYAHKEINVDEFRRAKKIGVKIHANNSRNIQKHETNIEFFLINWSMAPVESIKPVHAYDRQLDK